MILREKQILRTSMLATLAAFSGKNFASASLRHHLLSTPAWVQAKVIYGFHPLPSEPDWIGNAGIRGKQAAFPRPDTEGMAFFVGGKIVTGPHGAGQPEGGQAAPPPDLILVPGLAFTSSGHRLGRGGGFYDRWLAAHPETKTLGICFSCQMVDSLPIESHDIRVDAVFTEAGFSGKGAPHP
jgi:5,10-methenyltetrahydrofolate synthetase